MIRVDFPDPLTPVITVSFPRGNVASICFKLLPEQPCIVMERPLPGLLVKEAPFIVDPSSEVG